MRILFLSPRQCWPTRGGAKLREYHFARALAKHHELTYLHFTDPGSEPLTRAELPFCKEVVAIPKPGVYGVGKLIKGVVGRWPVSILNYTSQEMTDAVNRFTSNSAHFDLVHLDSIHMMRYAAHVPRVVYDWHNIESEAMQRYSSTVSSTARSFYARLTASKLGALEKEILHTGLGHVVCSEREREQLQRIAPSARIAVVENGVDTAGFTISATSESSHKIIFVGLMDYYPNVEAAVSFAQHVWPTLRQRLPQLELWIVGANPVPAVLQLGGIAGITVTGTVPDVRPYYLDAFAAVVPLRTGGGTRLKILEAMAAGVPVISTPLGAEGLAVTPGENILFTEPDDASTWVRHLAYLTEEKDGRQRLIEKALALTQQQYDWNTLGDKLSATYEGWFRDPA